MDIRIRFGRGVKAGVLWAVLSTAWPAGAAVDLSLQPVENPVVVGQTLSVALIATNDAAGEVQLVSAITAVLVWDPAVFRLVGVDNNGPIPWMRSGFLADPDGINNSFDDGDAIYTALASPGGPAGVPDAGLLITTLEFEALGPSPSSAIEIVAQLGQFGRTQVFDGTVANLDVLGSFEGTSVTVVACGKSDNEAPVITCPGDVKAKNDADACSAAVDPGMATATDNCKVAKIKSERTDGLPLTDPYPVGKTTITWTATDNAGNTASCIQQVVVNDNQDPTITCPDDVKVNKNTGECSATGVNLGTPVTDDNCAVDTVTNDAAEPFEVGKTIVTWTVADVNGRSATCTQQVVVNDDQHPTITCPDDIEVKKDIGLCQAFVDPGTATATDNCKVAKINGERTDGLPLTDPYPVGKTTITWMAIDNAGNTAACAQQITVLDTTPPVFDSCPSDIFVNADPGGCNAVVTYTDPRATDNCPNATVACDPPSGSKFPMGTTVVTCTATDASGNSSTCTFAVTVENLVSLDVEVELVGVNKRGCSRCIRFILKDAGGCDKEVHEVLDFDDHDADDANEDGIKDSTEGTTDEPSTPVRAITKFKVGCGDWLEVCAKEEQHTLSGISTLSPVGSQFVTDTVLSLLGGDTDNDDDVDINDVMWFIAAFGDLAKNLTCPWDDTRDADFDCNGFVGAGDFTFLSTNWLEWRSCSCTPSLRGTVAGVGSLLSSSVPITMLAPDIAERVDFNRDGVFDVEDVKIFERRHGLRDELSTKIGAALKLERGRTVKTR